MDLDQNTLQSWLAGRVPPAVEAASIVLLSGQDVGGMIDLALSLNRKTEDYQVHEGALPDADSLQAMLGTGSLFAPSTTLVFRDVQESANKIITQLIKDGTPEQARLVLIAPSLKTSSKLKKLVSGAPNGVVATLYQMRARDMAGFVKIVIEDWGLTIARDALQALPERLPGDRASARRRIETICLHAMGRGSSQVELIDVLAMLGVLDENALSAPLDRALSGQMGPAVSMLATRLERGENPIAMIRIMLSRAYRLLDIRRAAERASDCVARAKPPVFWMEKPEVEAIMRRNSETMLVNAIDILDRCEHDIVERGQPDNIRLSQAMVSISTMPQQGA